MENKNVDEGCVVSAILDIGLCMSVWSFARLNLSDGEKEAFFAGCSERLIEQGLNKSDIEVAISNLKQSVYVISEGLNGKDKH
jgi:hypothetical protein